ncbi:MAG: aspartate 1-decarboxylase [Myxococcota bacterium]
MERTLCKSKIHRATVTQADLHYEGSVTLDAALMKAADILPYEEVHVWNVTNGSRIVTYAIEGEAGSGVVCLNGSAARHTSAGDIVILATFARYSEEEAHNHEPKVIFVDQSNKLVRMGKEIAGPKLRTV